MNINKFIKLQNLIERGDCKTLDEVLRNDEIRLDASENAADGKFLANSVLHLTGKDKDDKEKKQKEIYTILKKYGSSYIFLR